MQQTRASLTGALVIVGAILAPVAARAEARSQGFVMAGAGATQLNAGGDWLIGGSAIGLGGELGVGNLLLGSVSGSFHPLAGRAASGVDPFAIIGFTGVSDLNNGASGVSVGGGLTYWVRRHLGIRLHAFVFRPTHDDIKAFSVHVSPRYWGVRAGIAF
jgi:hypothetical protein